MMISLQVAIAAVAGYWLGRAYPTQPGMAFAAASAGRLVGSPQEMVDETMNLLEASPEFAALDESVRGQLLDAVRVAAMTAVTARIEAAGEVAGASDEAPLTTRESVANTSDTTGQVAAADTTDTAGPVVDGNETSATDADDRGFGVAHARKRRSHATGTRAPTADTSEHGAQPDTGADEDTANGTTAALADDAPAADDGNAAASAPSTAEVRAWAHATGIAVSDHGRLSAEIWEAHAASPTPPPTAEVRAWAHTHGFTVSDRGQLSAEVREAYAAAHPAR
ncbi:Lsr2 family protein [Rhodococcus sp. T2V]|uniref:Lsr2 family DNA-binding protein n=1 Tax=Rhodococcus sp. T2V TaxID=3034164 RepID=UPI0023E1D94A|nr:histone-like nucleoid-structuring protein Lsr2 [Rhodococcus sp. T2V]MDF3312785.1 Lsr2 family protein [Rhodococcus sp. T2V]